MIPQYVNASNGNTKKERSYRVLTDDEFHSIRNGEYRCWNDYSLKKEYFETSDFAILGVSLINYPGISILLNIPIGIAIYITLYCIANFKDYQSLRREIGSVNLEKMGIYDLTDLTIIIGERRSKEAAKIRTHSDQMRSWRFGRDSAPQAIEVIGDRRAQSKALARDEGYNQRRTTGK